MRLRSAALAVVIVAFAARAFADVPVPAPPAPFYKSVSPEQMMELLKSQGATEVRRISTIENEFFVWAETPVGPIEVAFSQCHEAPNPCGYIIMSRYRNLPLTAAQMAQFNGRPDLTYVFREKGSKDVLLAFPVAVRTGLPREYVLSSFGMLAGMTEVFEDWLMKTLHYKSGQIYHHAE